MIAEIIINSNAKALNRIFDYIVPKELENNIKMGNRVFVPFGKGNKAEEGYIIGFKSESEFANKEILRIEDGLLTENNIELAKLMSMKYFCNISECIKLMLPPGAAGKNIENRVKDKTLNFVYLNKEIDEIEIDIEEKILKSDKQIKLLRFLEENDGINISELEAVTEVSKAVMKTLEKNGYIQIIEEKVDRNPFLHKKIERDKKLVLTEKQQEVYDTIEFMIDNEEFTEFLLHGVTGSGKTEVYMQLIEKVINNGKSAIILVPEISLTPQMVDRFLARFGDVVAVLHSKLSVGERFDEWKKIKEDRAKIVIGARSAIFAPVKDLGIIIIDESHDSSYKSDMTPRYNAKDLAKYICKKNNCVLLQGSATPDIVDYYRAQNGDIELLELTERANKSSLPEIDVVDLRYELASGNKSMLSEKLQKEISKNLENKKQTILFLNRRGYSTFVMCRDCGYTVKCPNCDITLTYHIYENKLKCHYCGHEKPPVNICPECNSNRIKYFGSGTQKLEDEIKKLYPEASTIRMDIDTVSKKNGHEEILNTFKNENIDILIGTQMVVKGHHFPNVTLVGVVAADTSLGIDDYRAVERTFQTITQVAGRAGREKENGKVIVQTYNPDNYAIELSKKQDYKRFYNAEIELRKRLNYPPFCDIICIRVNSKNENEAPKVCNIIYDRISKITYQNMNIFKPVPAPIDKIKNTYRWRIIMKCKLDKNVLRIIDEALKTLEKYKFNNTSVVIDINPTSMN